ncbi:aromatic acid decarboxylase [Zobellella endophytica]|uniref:Flavin prenyltransferase UbiX n=1 Tax=Zobellella endophytica TaxID=2116700 RepID=A0A2P7QWP4_9GAMM|nr:flavin prenyltransferase UbiX [Zobellella endophytica]PSJ42398.1 aromatic acid decarboxylase [Zobellella endophytica]
MAEYPRERQITLALSGASGAPYALALLERLLAAGIQVHLLVSGAARVVLATEQGEQWPGKPEVLAAWLGERYSAVPGQIRVYGKEEWFSPVASGSGAPRRMVICPCSMGTVASIAAGVSDNLIERAADVVIKEKGQLILVPRETPFSALHLENLLKLARLGVTIMPAAPGFYHQPQSIADLVDFMVARILDHLGLEQDLVQRWGYGGGES